MRAHRFWFSVLFLFPLACSESSEPELATITQVGPGSVEPGDVIQILGRGFVEGPATVTLSGDFKPHGLGKPRKRRVALLGTATSENRVEVKLDSRQMKQVVEEPSRFFGGVEVEFPVAAGAVRIFAVTSGVTVDFRPGGGGVATAAKHEREASRFLSNLGMLVLDSHDIDGLVVGEIREGSAAHAAGIEFGDRLLAIDGAAITGTAELAGIQPAEQHTFEIVSRKGAVREVSVSDPSRRWVDDDEFTAILLSSVAFGLFIALAAPKRRRWDGLRIGPSDPFSRALGVALVSLMLILVPAAGFLIDSSYLISVVLLGLNALGLTVLLALADPKRRSLFSALFSLVLIPAWLLVSGYLSSAAGLREIVASQESSPFGVHAVASPFSLLVVVSSLFLLWPVQPGKPGRQKLSSAAAWVAAAPAAAAVSACFLGGWSVPFTSPTRGGSSAMVALGCLIFLAKTWLVLLTARWLASYDLMDRRAAAKARRPVVPATVVVLSTVAAVAWAMFELPPGAEPAGVVVSSAMLTTLLTALAVFGARRVVFGPALPKNIRYQKVDESPVRARASLG